MPDVLKNFKKAYPDGELLTKETFIYDGVLLITEDGLASFFGVTVRQILNLKKAGMQTHRASTKGAKVYDIIYVIKWWESHKKKILPSQFVTDSKEDDRPIEEQTEEELDRKLKVEKVKIERLKHSELAGKLVKAEDLDRAMAEQGVLHRTYYMDDLELLPVALDGMDKDEISAFLDEHYSSRIENASSFINKLFKTPDHFYKKIMGFLNEKI